MPVSSKLNIPFNKPYLNSSVIGHIKAVLDTGKISGDGTMCKSVEQSLCRLFSLNHVLLTTSCTHALEMAMMMLDLKPGDEVILPSFTFVSTANAIIRGGGKPVFCEINDRTLTLDIQDFESRITKKTRAVIPVHYAGVAAEMDDVCRISRDHNLRIVEDAAQGVNAKYKGKYLGTIGDAAAYSFHDTKNYVSGEGGAFVTNNEALARKGEIIREKGTNRSNFLRGQVDKYTWVEHGSSYILSDILAAVLTSQLEDLEKIQTERKRVHDRYMDGLKDLEKNGRLRLPVIPEHCESNYHIFFILVRSEQERDTMIRKLKESGIGSTFHYVPLHSSPYAVRALGTRDLRLPVTDRVFQTLIRLPIYPQLENSEVDYVVAKIREILR